MSSDCRALPRLLLPLILLYAVSVWAVEGAAAVPSSQKQVTITADFGKWVDYPLVKTKFAAYNSGWVPGQLKTYNRDINLFDEVHPDALRIDGVLGSPKGILFSDPPIVSGTLPNLKYDFRQADELIKELGAHSVGTYWCYSYVPESLGGTYKTPPVNLADWGQVVGEFARHFKESGHPTAYHEVYNEPDNRDFFAGTVQDYIALYETAVKSIRAADPDAAVGGPALAFTDAWIEPFLDHVTASHLPLDFFSFHYYPGVPYKARNVRELVDTIGDELDKYPRLATTEMHLNEYNALPINYPQDGPQQKHRLAASLLNDFAYFITEPCLTKVHWAQFMDTGGGNWSGLVSIDGHRKAAFNAWRIYARMPVDRRMVTVNGPSGIGGMASSDEHKSGLVIWNLTGADQPMSLRLEHIPFARGTLRVYRIDADHASWGDNPAHEDLIPVETRKDIAMRSIEWAGGIPDGGVVYLEVEDGTKTTKPAPVTNVDRVLYSFADRRSTAYADFDRSTWTARLGMGSEKSADAIVGVKASDLPAVVEISLDFDGIPHGSSKNSLLGLYVDYQVSGKYMKSVLFLGWFHDRKGISALPWGKKSPPDEVVQAHNLPFTRLDLAKHAPKGWKGDAIVTFVMKNASVGTKAKFVVSRPTHP